MPAVKATPKDVRQELEKILTSAGFARNDRIGKFLSFVVEQRLEGKAEQLKETLIGAEVFGRKADYDPKLDSIVRTEAARLRVRLAEYFAGEGAADPVVIELPKGGYAPLIRSHAPPATGRVSARWRRAVIAAGVAALAGVGWLWMARPMPERPVIAVLPFKNLSVEPESEFFADGLTDEIIHKLSVIDGLEVRSRTSSFVFKDKPRNISDVGAQMHANLAVEGSVLRTGDRLRINVQLIRVSGDRTLWSDQFDRELKDVFAVQEEISRSIVDKLRLKLPPRTKKWPTESPEAFALYLRGRSALESSTGASAKTALQFFERAIALDPEYAAAHAGMAESYFLLAFNGRIPPKEAYPKVEQAARKGLSLDESLSEAHVALSRVKYAYEWDWPGAEREFRRAIELNPNSVPAHSDYGMILSLEARFDESLEQVRLAESLDPLSAKTTWLRASTLYYARRYEESLDQSRRTLEIDPSYTWAYQMIGQCYLEQGRFDEAIQAFLRAGVTGDASIAFAYVRAGRVEEAQRILSIARRRYQERDGAALAVARAYVALGEVEQAFKWLERAYQERDGYLVTLKVAPLYDPLRSDPRFDELLRRVGLQARSSNSHSNRN
jgi:TolB-like protein